MSSYNHELADGIKGLIAAAYGSEDVALSFLPEFDKSEAVARQTRVYPLSDVTQTGEGNRVSDVHTCIVAVSIWYPFDLADGTILAQMPAQLEYAEGVLAATRRVQDTIGSVLWGWQSSSFDPLYDPDTLRDDFEFLSWIAVQFQGMTP